MPHYLYLKKYSLLVRWLITRRFYAISVFMYAVKETANDLRPLGMYLPTSRPGYLPDISSANCELSLLVALVPRMPHVKQLLQLLQLPRHLLAKIFNICRTTRFQRYLRWVQTKFLETLSFIYYSLIHTDLSNALYAPFKSMKTKSKSNSNWKWN